MSTAPASAQPDMNPLPRREPRWNATVAVFLLLMHGLAVAGLFGPWTAGRVVFACGLYVMLGIGTTVGLHRLLCHRSFACPRWVECALVTMAMPTGQGSPLLWAANHRLHHARSDRAEDVHSPRRGLFYSHVGWIADDASTEEDGWQRWCKDMADEPYYHWLIRFRMVPHVLGALIVAAVFGWRALPAVYYLPMVLWMNSTYAVNSLCHLQRLGSAPFHTGEGSRNVLLFGLLAFGEGWHNNHHRFPRSARHGLLSGQVDVSWWVIRALERLGLAWDVWLPRPERLQHALEERPPLPRSGRASALTAAVVCAALVGASVVARPAIAAPGKKKPIVLDDGTVVLPAPEPTQGSFAGVSMIAGTPLLLVGAVFVGTAWQRDRALKADMQQRDIHGDIAGIAWQTARTEADAIAKRWRRGWWLTGIGGALLTTGIVLRATTDEPPVFGALAPTRSGLAATVAGRF